MRQGRTGLGAAGTALIEHERKLLFERRADADVWGLIGGGVEDDETLEAALRREVHEETGLLISSYEFFGTSLTRRASPSTRTETSSNF
jgi:8-oxo-dGTP pyrophosphatase MutT (NUDIX family)